MSIEKDQVQLLIDECRYGVSGKGPAIEVANDLLNSCCDNLVALMVERDQLNAQIEDLRNPASKKTDCGHGHVYPSISGYMAKCGGPGLCAMCSRDAATKSMAMENQRIVPVKHECVKGYGHGGQWCGPDFNCWLDPRSKSEKNGHGKGCVCSVCTQ